MTEKALISDLTWRSLASQREIFGGLQMFEPHEIPTGYTEKKLGMDVAKAIQERNPNAKSTKYYSTPSSAASSLLLLLSSLPTHEFPS